MVSVVLLVEEFRHYPSMKKVKNTFINEVYRGAYMYMYVVVSKKSQTGLCMYTTGRCMHTSWFIDSQWNYHKRVEPYMMVVKFSDC